MLLIKFYDGAKFFYPSRNTFEMRFTTFSQKTIPKYLENKSL